MRSRFSNKALFFGAGVTGACYYASSNSACKTYMSHAKEELRTQLRKVEESHPTANYYASLVGSFSFVNFSIDRALACKHLSKVPLGLKVGLSFIPGILLPLEFVNGYYRFLSAPVNAIRDVAFSQSPYLISRISWRSSNYKRLNGVCYGATLTWAEYIVSEKNLMPELKKPVFSINDTVLEKIDRFQEEGKIYIPANTMCWPLSSASSSNIDNVATEVIDKAVNNQGILYNLILCDDRSSSAGHVIGVMASNIKDKLIIKYFDSNLREATFQDKDSAQKSLALNLRYGGYAQRFHGKPKSDDAGKLSNEELDDDVSFAFIKERKIL